MKPHIWLTRPEGENETLAARLEGEGYDVSIRPLVKLSPVEITKPGKKIVMDLDLYDSIIFVSKSSVTFGIPMLDAYWPQWPIALKWFSVGKGTAEALSGQGIEAAYPEKAGSEGLLALPELEQVDGTKVLIVRGEGGREHLALSLRERGASVTYLEAYRRDTVNHESWHCTAASQITLLTSVEIIENLVDQARQYISRMNVIAASTRIAEAAKTYQFRSVTIAGGASDQALYDAVVDLSREIDHP